MMNSKKDHIDKFMRGCNKRTNGAGICGVDMSVPQNHCSVGYMERGRNWYSVMLCTWIVFGILKETSIEFKLFFSLSTFKLLCEHDL